MGMFDYSVLWKTSLNIDGHPFHQYQHNEQSLLILTELTKHKKNLDIWRWKSRYLLGTGKAMWWGILISIVYIIDWFVLNVQEITCLNISWYTYNSGEGIIFGQLLMVVLQMLSNYH